MFGSLGSLVLHKYTQSRFARRSFVGGSLVGVLGETDLDDSGSLLLAYLVGSLPPTISAICFDSILTKKSLEALEILLRTGASNIGNKQNSELMLKVSKRSAERGGRRANTL